jgi:hypothetical protein
MGLEVGFQLTAFETIQCRIPQLVMYQENSYRQSMGPVLY